MGESRYLSIGKTTGYIRWHVHHSEGVPSVEEPRCPNRLHPPLSASPVAQGKLIAFNNSFALGFVVIWEKRGRGGENGREKSGDDVEGEGREGKKRRDERIGGEGEGETGDERGAGGRTGSEGGEGEGWDAETTTEEG
ncbi:hypothetical protein BHE74_00057740 [Ensete ventricosum]|nr:hypothetical protein BHE74_00057740 [Ensete ventricosum]